jgi:PERQ amino acid-rich with GYF domain-containing protein
LVSAVPASQNDTQDDAHPFRYTKEELLRIYKESPKGGLGLEVERWEGVVREIGSDPVGLREMGEGEKKVSTTILSGTLTHSFLKALRRPIEFRPSSTSVYRLLIPFEYVDLGRG